MDATRYAQLLHRHRWRVLGTWLLAVVLAAAGLTGLSPSTDFDIYFSEDNPQLAAYDRFERVFTSQDSLTFLVRTEPGRMLDPQSLAALAELTERAWLLPHARRVSSLINHPYTRVDDDWLETEDLVPDPAAPPPDLLDLIASEPGLLGSQLSQDLAATVVTVTLALPRDAAEGNAAVMAEARALRAELAVSYPEVDVMIGGSAATNVTLTEAVTDDVSKLVVLSYSIIILGLVILLRSVRATAATLVVITCSIAGTMGLFGWAGYIVSPVTSFVPSMVMTIAVADSVHLLVTWFHERRGGADPLAAMTESLRVNIQPITLTSLTTVIGVLSLNLSDSPPYRDMGNMVAVGVTVAWALSLSLLPALLMIAPGEVGGRNLARELHPLSRLAGWIIAQRRVLLVAIGALTVVMAWGVTRNELTERWHQYFSDSFEVRRAMDATDEALSGIHALHFMLDSGTPDGINDPAYLQQVAAFDDWLSVQPGVGAVSTLADTIGELDRKFAGRPPLSQGGVRRIPDDRELIAQYLLLYELSLPEGVGLDTMINVDRSATRASLIAHRTDSETLIELEAAAVAWLAANAPAVSADEATGLDMMFAHINHRNIRSTLQGMAIALLLISLVLIVALRSVKLGLVSLVPNFGPAITAYGIWGFTVGRVDLAISIVSALSLGIVVDDTVHFVSKYRRAVVEKGLSPTEGVRYAFRTVGVALVITTVVLVAGFSVLGFSSFNPSRETGLLLAMTLGIALIIDFLLLPPVLIAVEGETSAVAEAAMRQP